MGWGDEIQKDPDWSPRGGREPITPIPQYAPPSRTPIPQYNPPAKSSMIGGCVMLSLVMLAIATIAAYTKDWGESAEVYWGFACGFLILGLLADFLSDSNSKRGCLAYLLLIVWIFYGLGLVVALLYGLIYTLDG